ncbi:DUF2914 domain-containing protein [Kaarinaea lacus]
MITQTFNRLAVVFALTLLICNTIHAEEKSASPEDATKMEDTTASTPENVDSTTSPETNATEETTVTEEKSTTETATQEAPQKAKNTHRRIARAQFTTAIADREPTDNIVMLTNNNEKIYFFTELINFNGQNIKHRWEYEGKEMAIVNFKVNGSRWRVHSSKNIKPEWKGIWSVTVYDGDDRPLKITSFEVVDADIDK